MKNEENSFKVGDNFMQLHSRQVAVVYVVT